MSVVPVLMSTCIASGKKLADDFDPDKLTDEEKEKLAEVINELGLRNSSPIWDNIKTFFKKIFNRKKK